MVSILRTSAKMALAGALALTSMTPIRHFIAPRRPAGVKKDAAPGAGAQRARARLQAERAATAKRLANAAPPKVTRQQLRAECHRQYGSHGAFRLYGWGV